MTESSWEASRSAQRKKLHLILLIALPIVFLATILIVNNRDLIVSSGTPEEETVADVPVVPQNKAVVPPKDSTVKPPEKERGKSPAVIVSPVKPVRPDTPAAPGKVIAEKEKPVERSVPVAAEIPKKDTVVSAAQRFPRAVPKFVAIENRYSEVLPPVRCELKSRKDIVISLTLELFFRDEDDRAVLRLYREDLKVMILKCVFSADLTEMKIQILEKHLLKNINSIFDHEIITDVKVKNIQIEKARG